MADAMRLPVGERVAVYGWVGCQYRKAAAGTIIRFWVTGLGEWSYTVLLDAAEPDGVCLVEATGEDLVKIDTPAKRVNRPRPPRGSNNA